MLREWAPLTDFLNKLPIKLNKTLFQKDIKLTCVDVLPEYFVLGTNVGSIFLFERRTKDLLRLSCEKNNIVITCVKILSTVDYMIASASETGSISIFQIPKSHPETLPESLRPKSKQIEKYVVNDLHKGPVTKLEWSKNGMKLFSGDKNGLVVLTEIDFYMHICKSTEILNESYEVVQLSYCQQHLLVSTTYRSIICQQSNKWKVSQIGRKDRKILGHFGGLIFQKSYKISELCLYCSRPGLRIWTSDIEGNVHNTLLFKELLTKECPEVPIINPISKKLQAFKPQKEISFGILLPFDENFLVTYSNDMVFILDPKKMIIVAVVSQLRGVLDVATSKDEIFILEEDRNLIRISYNPEPEYNVGTSDLLCNAYFPLSTSLKGLTEKLQSAYPELGKAIDIYTDETAVVYVEEATGSPIKANKYDSHEKFEKLGAQKFTDEILFKKSSKNTRMCQSVISVSSNSSDDTTFKPLFMNSFTGVLPDVRSPESIKYDIEEKEKILEKMLDLDKVEIPDISRLENIDNKSGNLSQNIDIIPSNVIEKKNMNTFSPKHISSDKNKSKVTYDKKSENNHELVSRKNLTHEPKALKKESFTEVPSCSPVPSKWILTDLQIRDRKDSNPSESSMSDWEIV